MILSKIESSKKRDIKHKVDIKNSGSMSKNKDSLISEQESKLKEMEYINKLNENIICELFKEKMKVLNEECDGLKKGSPKDLFSIDKVDGTAKFSDKVDGTAKFSDNSLSSDSNKLNIENGPLLKDIILKKFTQKNNPSTIFEKSESKECSDMNSIDRHGESFKIMKRYSKSHSSVSNNYEEDAKNKDPVSENLSKNKSNLSITQEKDENLIDNKEKSTSKN